MIDKTEITNAGEDPKVVAVNKTTRRRVIAIVVVLT